MIDDAIRSPTMINNLRVLAKGYLTDKAAEFEKRFKEGKYQAAAYIKDSCDAIYVFANAIGLLDQRDTAWYYGEEGRGGLFDADQEAVCKARVEGQDIQDEVMRRYENLVSRLQHAFHYRANEEVGTMGVLLLKEQLESVRQAQENREKAKGHRY